MRRIYSVIILRNHKKMIRKHNSENTNCSCVDCYKHPTNSPCCEPNDLVYTSNPPQNKCKNCGQFWFCKDPAPICHSKPAENKETEEFVGLIDGVKEYVKLDSLLAEFEKRFSPQIMNESMCFECKTDFPELKSFLRKVYKAGRQNNLERLIADCGDRFAGLIKHTDWYDGHLVKWEAHGAKEGDGKGFGSTPTEAVENLIKALDK